MIRSSCLVLVLAAGCAPSLTVANSIGVVKNNLVDDAVATLEREGILVERGDRTLGVTGIRVPPEDSFWATKILLQWRRDKEPEAFISYEEFRLRLED